MRPLLKILILEGDGATNVISTRHATTPVVEVRDDNDLPVEGAQVVFELPGSGPGGLFPGQQRTRTARSNVQGQAGAPFIVNDEPGSFEIKIRASFGDKFGEARLTQTNVFDVPPEHPPRRWLRRWPFWAAVGGGAAVAIILVSRSGGADAITITPGPPTFGGSR